MKREAVWFGEQTLDLLYIAKKLKDALRLEDVLTASGIDYAVETDEYVGGVLFRSARVGAFFYVLPDAVERARAVMEENGFRAAAFGPGQ